MAVENGVSHGENVAGVLERNAQRFGVETHELTGRRRFRPVARAKASAQLEMRDSLAMSYSEIGRFFGLDHSTIISNVRRARQAIGSEGEVIFDNPTAVDENIERYLHDNFPDISLEDVKGKTRAARIVIPRQAVVRYLFQNGVYVGLIADKLNRDHSSVIHAINKSGEKIQAEVERWKFLEKRKQDRQKVKEKPQELSKLKLQEIQKEEQERVKREKAQKDSVFAEVTLDVVANHYGVHVDEIISNSREKRVTQPRKTAQYIIFKGTDYSFLKISELMGRIDHSTAISAIQTVEHRLGIDEEFGERLDELQEEIRRQTALRFFVPLNNLTKTR